MTYFFTKSHFSKDLKYIFVYTIIVFVLVGTWLLNGFFSPDWNEISSGRIFAWAERITILQNYDLKVLLFGQGYGADIMKTKQWWWEAKASHNDFISIIFNSGLISLILFFMIFLSLFKKANSFQKAMLVFLFITSATNTGLLGRPIQFLIFCFIYILANNLTSKIENVK
jgi:hypothetical protein